MTERRCSNPSCGGVLLEEWGRYRWCPTCREKRAADIRALRATVAGRKKNAEHQRTYKRTHRDDVNASRMDKYQAKKESGECVCCKARALPDSNWCQTHRDAHSRDVKAWRQRRAARKAAEAALC